MAAPATPTSSEVMTAFRSPRLIPNASPMIGNMSGATIIAPITAATESESNPKVEIAAASVSRIQKRMSFV